MAGDKTKKDKRDRDRIADEGYEVEHLAETTGITRSQAFGLIQKHGKDRATLVLEARKLKKG
jgi:hypothetical protein